MSVSRTFYEILGVDARASFVEIRSAFLAKAGQVHPDLSDVADQDFKRIRHIYEVLRDPLKRAAYDKNPKPFHRAVRELIPTEEFVEHEFAFSSAVDQTPDSERTPFSVLQLVRHQRSRQLPWLVASVLVATLIMYLGIWGANTKTSMARTLKSKATIRHRDRLLPSTQSKQVITTRGESARIAAVPEAETATTVTPNSSADSTAQTPTPSTSAWLPNATARTPEQPVEPTVAPVDFHSYFDEIQIGDSTPLPTAASAYSNPTPTPIRNPAFDANLSMPVYDVPPSLPMQTSSNRWQPSSNSYSAYQPSAYQSPVSMAIGQQSMTTSALRFKPSTAVPPVPSTTLLDSPNSYGAGATGNLGAVNGVSGLGPALNGYAPIPPMAPAYLPSDFGSSLPSGRIGETSGYSNTSATTPSHSYLPARPTALGTPYSTGSSYRSLSPSRGFSVSPFAQ
ncbi:MAG: DnaJ domain-containing protein [Planctomycetales bacterium]|nr:DnaJ domain-containing protein [Planctomycetales bacterium]